MTNDPQIVSRIISQSQMLNFNQKNVSKNQIPLVLIVILDLLYLKKNRKIFVQHERLSATE